MIYQAICLKGISIPIVLLVTVRLTLTGAVKRVYATTVVSWITTEKLVRKWDTSWVISVRRQRNSRMPTTSLTPVPTTNISLSMVHKSI